MNHLHHVIESINSKRVTLEENLTDQQKAVVSSLLQNSPNAICFDAGDAEEILGLGGIPQLVRLPYDVCWIEAVAQGALIGCLCVNQNEYSFFAVPLNKQPQTDWYIGAPIYIQRSPTGIKYHIPQLESLDWHQCMAAMIARFLSAMNCKNVGKVECKPPEKLNKVRARRGKCQLFSTWTLVFSIPGVYAEKSAPQGGAHASPRVHLRRGHPREYKPGLFTWVQPCAVGSKKNGVIHKDYKAVIKTKDTTNEQRTS